MMKGIPIMVGLLILFTGCSDQKKSVLGLELEEKKIVFIDPKTKSPLEGKPCTKEETGKREEEQCPPYAEESKVLAIENFALLDSGKQKEITIIKSEKNIGSVKCCVSICMDGYCDYVCETYEYLNSCPEDF